MKRFAYPFSAIVGQHKMRTALLLNAVDSGIGGVLISGQKGTGKSTAVRALPGILPPIDAVKDCPYHCDPRDHDRLCDTCRGRIAAGEALATVSLPMPLVEFPLSATEDRVVGTLHVEHALKTGGRMFDPGLLAKANRGILYVDEVNLLDDHLVDILLDAAASGVNIVEREGISHIHPARFLLVGTMNPEEGDLRPQFLDRFGLSLTVQSEEAPEMRTAIVQRHLAAHSDPAAFSDQWQPFETLLARQIQKGRHALDGIVVSDAMLDLAVALSMAARTQGHRAEIAIVKTARTLAALLERPQVEKPHIAEAARFVLPHRIAQEGIHSVEDLLGHIDELIEDVLNDRQPALPPKAAAPDIDDAEWDDGFTQVPGAWAASNVDMVFSFLEKKKRFLTPTNASASRMSISTPST